MNKHIAAFISIILALCFLSSCAEKNSSSEKKTVVANKKEVNATYSIRDIDTAYFKETCPDMKSDADKKSFTDAFSMSVQEQKALFEHPEDYYFVYITLTVNNNLGYDINNIEWNLIPSNGKVWRDSNSVLTPLDRIATAHTDSNISDTFVVKVDNDFYNFELGNYIRGLTGEAKIDGASATIKMSAQDNGYADITNQYEEVDLSSIKDKSVLKKAFSPVVKQSDAISLSYFCSKVSEFTGITRKTDAGFYSVVRFQNNGTICYGISFFDNKMAMKGGMFVSTLQEEAPYSHLIKNKSTFADVQKIDRGAYAFENSDGSLSSYHWLKKGGYIKIDYTKSKAGELTVKSVERKKDDKKLLSLLMPQDLELLGGVTPLPSASK